MSRLLRYVGTGTSAVLAAVSVALPATAATDPDPTVVRIENGLVRGIASGDVRVFRAFRTRLHP